MWYIYISIAVLFRGAICYPAKQIRYQAKQIRYPANQIAEDSNCTVVITRFGEQVTTLEVKWNSDIHLICNASCVGSGPQPALTWFYRDKINQSNLVNIERLFRSPKFETSPTTFHRRNELVIRKFGPNEETDFICYGSTKRPRQEAKVTLIGTDCLLKYNFRCKSGDKCIDRAYLCNKNNECPDGEDEIGCGNDINATTTVATIRIPEEGVVIENTSDESDYNDVTTTVSTILRKQTDEKTMQTSTKKPVVSCRGDQFQCADGNCVEARMKCDGTPQCEDGSDEQNCACAQGFFRCNDGNCVPDRLRCDGIPQCKDGSDEIQCEPVVSCIGDQFQCADGNCVEARMKCDGTPQCEDGSDEQNCRCPPDNFQCETTSNLECVDTSLVCDGFPDCTDKSDEAGCPSCRTDQFTCTDGNCVEGNMRCDGRAQCEDGSDEIECPFRCAFGQFKCAGLDDCVAESFRCDGRFDCSDRSDELNCTCRENQFQCGDGICIDVRHHCDGTVDCVDKSDELACLCRSGQFQCRNGACIPEGFKCNGRAECEDGSDEENCVATAAPRAVCTADQYKCASGDCVDGRYRCDGKPDCSDGSDETNCQMPFICTEGRIACKDSSKCISDSQVCDKIPDCTDGSDEKDCGLSNELQTSRASQQKEDGKYDVTEGNEPETSRASQQKEDGKYDVTEEQTKILLANTGINDDGDNGLLSATDVVAEKNVEYADTTPFDYDFYT
ncbi:hypothetical protein ACJMK2_007220 [Sinanodonta woodiana]|uniref:Ig-like domain-containing protein n=1 Tax=Sinanodonta woodiana TaxID=1069815 RepID=A0ABD3VJD7_SINWO